MSTTRVRTAVVTGLAIVIASACAGNQESLRREAAKEFASGGGEFAAAAPVVPEVDGTAGIGAPAGGATEAALPAVSGPAPPGATASAPTAAAAAPAQPARAQTPAVTGRSSSPAGQVAAPGTPAATTAAGAAQAPAAGAAPGSPAAAAAPAPAGGNGGATDVGVTADKVLVGGVFFHESYLDRYSRVSEHALRAYFNEVNKAGGIYGRKIEYVGCIDGGDASRSRACFKDLVENKKMFMIGPTFSWSTGTIQEYIKAQKIPFVGSFGLYLEEYQPDNRYSFPSQVPVFEIARLFGKFLIEHVKPKTVGISYLNIQAAQECMTGLEDYLNKAGVKVVAKVSNEFDEPDLTSQVLKMRSANPDIVAFCNDPVNNAKFVGIAARSQRYKPPMGWIGGWPTVPEFGKIVGDWGIGHYGFSSVCYHESPECDADPDVRLFKQQMNAYYPGEMERMHYYGQNLWCGAKMIVEAMKLAGPNLTRESFLGAMDSGAFFGWKCQGMEIFYKTGVRDGSKGGQMHQLDEKGRWRMVRNTYRAD